MKHDQPVNQTTARGYYCHVCRDEKPKQEIERLRALVTRLTNVAQSLASELPDPGAEALAAIHCGRNFIHG